MTIKRRVRVALLLMMLVPAFLMIGAFWIARAFSRDTSESGPFGHPRLLSAEERSFLGEFNRLVNDDPRSLSDPRTLAGLDDLFGRQRFGGWVILRDGREIYRSATSWRWPAHGNREPDLTWNFRFENGSAGKLLLYSGMSWRPPFRGPGWFAGFFAVLIGCNALLGWWISSSIVAPLGRLRRAAVRIGDGDLDFRLAPSGPDELGEVTTAFETMREKLQAAVTRQLAEETSRKELIAHVSHDLRTPVNLIRGYAEGLRDGVASTAPMRLRYLETILERARELEKLIELLFAYSTMDLEGVRPKLAPLDVRPYFSSLRDSLAAAFPSAAISLALPPVGLWIRADGDLTRRVMSNLVDNAVSHGGKPLVAVEWRIARAEAPTGVEVVVSDDGAGVSAEDLPRIFEPFFRADRARTRRQRASGAGLGLSIVSRIMQAQGGSVRAAPGPAGGLQVTLSFVEAERGVEAHPHS